MSSNQYPGSDYYNTEMLVSGHPTISASTTAGRLEWTSRHKCTSSGWSPSSRFWDEPKTHPLPLPRDFSALFSVPKFTPPTPILPPSPHFPLTPFLGSLGELLSLSSWELQGDTRHKAWGKWKAQRWKNMERTKHKECFIPNAEVEER
jgi:hypothetical protein